MHTQNDVICINNFFTEEEVDVFCHQSGAFLDSGWSDAEVTGPLPYNPKFRKTKIKTLRPSSDNLFLTKLIYGVVEANERKFKKSINSYFLEALNLLKYTHDNDCFKMHNDAGRGIKVASRKLSSIVVLSDSSEYEGGSLVFYGNDRGQNRFRIRTNKGALVMFPSEMYHEVTPVTVGTRLSLVMWVG